MGDGGRIILVGEDGQSRLVLEPPATPAPQPGRPANGMGERDTESPETLFDLIREPTTGVTASGSFIDGETETAPLASGERTAVPLHAGVAATAAAFRYERRTGLIVPERIRTERMPRDVTSLIESLVRNVRFLPEHLLAVRQETAPIERREASLFDGTAQTRRIEQSTINFQFARQNAHELLSVSQ